MAFFSFIHLRDLFETLPVLRTTLEALEEEILPAGAQGELIRGGEATWKELWSSGMNEGRVHGGSSDRSNPLSSLAFVL